MTFKVCGERERERENPPSRTVTIASKALILVSTADFYSQQKQTNIVNLKLRILNKLLEFPFFVFVVVVVVVVVV